MDRKTCNHTWVGYSGGRSCIECGYVERVERIDVRMMWFAVIAWSLLISLVLLTGCASSPAGASHTTQYAPQDAPAGQTAYGDLDDVRRAAAHYFDTDAPPERPAPPVEHETDEQLPAPANWRIELSRIQADGLNALDRADRVAPASLIAVYGGLLNGYSVDQLWGAQRSGMGSIGEVSEMLREPFRRVLIALGKRRGRFAVSARAEDEVR